MRRFGKIIGGLAAALSLASLGCNPADFDGLADDAWADARSPSNNSTSKNVFIGYAPRNDVQVGETGASSAPGHVRHNDIFSL